MIPIYFNLLLGHNKLFICPSGGAEKGKNGTIIFGFDLLCLGLYWVCFGILLALIGFDWVCIGFELGLFFPR